VSLLLKDTGAVKTENSCARLGQRRQALFLPCIVVLWRAVRWSATRSCKPAMGGTHAILAAMAAATSGREHLIACAAASEDALSAWQYVVYRRLPTLPLAQAHPPPTLHSHVASSVAENGRTATVPPAVAPGAGRGPATHQSDSHAALGDGARGYRHGDPPPSHRHALPPVWAPQRAARGWVASPPASWHSVGRHSPPLQACHPRLHDHPTCPLHHDTPMHDGPRAAVERGALATDDRADGTGHWRRLFS